MQIQSGRSRRLLLGGHRVLEGQPCVERYCQHFYVWMDMEPTQHYSVHLIINDMTVVAEVNRIDSFIISYRA